MSRSIPIRFSDEEVATLERLSKERGMTQAAVIREGLARFAAAHEEELREQALDERLKARSARMALDALTELLGEESPKSEEVDIAFLLGDEDEYRPTLRIRREIVALPPRELEDWGDGRKWELWRLGEPGVIGRIEDGAIHWSVKRS